MDWNVIDNLMEKFGCKTQREFGDLLGRRENTISDWRRKNLLPTAAIEREIIQVGQKRHVSIVPDDFFPPELRGSAEVQAD